MPLSSLYRAKDDQIYIFAGFAIGNDKGSHELTC